MATLNFASRTALPPSMQLINRAHEQAYDIDPAWVDMVDSSTAYFDDDAIAMQLIADSAPLPVLAAWWAGLAASARARAIMSRQN